MPVLMPVLMPSSSRLAVPVEKDRRKGRKGRKLRFAALTALKTRGGKSAESGGTPIAAANFVRLPIRSIVAP